MSYGKVQYYTVTFGASEVTEFDDFENKTFPDHQEEHNELYSALYKMIDRGVKTFFFKPERAAFYLPNVNENTKNENDKDFGIRLYCAIPFDNVVILLNGDVKTASKPEDCPNVRDHCLRAMKLAAKLEREKQQGNLQSESDLLDFETDI